jgi:hypothetical protein
MQEVSVIPLGIYELHEKWCSESLTLRKDLNEILPIFSTLIIIIIFSDLGNSVQETSTKNCGLILI